MGTSEQGPGGYGVFSLQSLLTAAVSGLDPSKKCPSAGSPCVNTWCPWPHSGSQQDSSDADPHNRCPGWSEEGVRAGQSGTWPRPIRSPRVGGGTDLEIGTAGPALMAIPAAGLVIMAEVPLPTVHVPHIHVRASGQVGSVVGRIHFLFTGSGLYIAGIPSRTAVLAVLTAHSLGV